MTMVRKQWIALGATMAVVAGIAACAGDSVTAAGSSRLVVRLTDAPLADSVQAVEMFIVRVEARAAQADSTASDSTASDSVASSHGGWVTIASPNKAIDILKLADDTTTIGDALVPNAQYRSLRLILDPSKSSVTLRDGGKLTGTSVPGIKFPSAAQTGIKVHVAAPDSSMTVDSTTTVVLDFDLEQSFVVRGNSVSKGGLTFKPVIRAAVKAGAKQ